jgi:hypothetical protein
MEGSTPFCGRQRALPLFVRDRESYPFLWEVEGPTPFRGRPRVISLLGRRRALPFFVGDRDPFWGDGGPYLFFWEADLETDCGTFSTSTAN